MTGKNTEIEVDDTVRFIGKRARWVVGAILDGGARYEVWIIFGNRRRGGETYISREVAASRVELVRKGNRIDDAVDALDRDLANLGKF